MHVISRKALRTFWEVHSDSKAGLARWYQLVRRTTFANFAELCKAFPGADKVGRLVVFNIGGNKYRLVASVHFNRHKLYVRHVLTHREYDEGAWKT